MRFQVGDFSVAIVNGGRFRLDGGAMFGVIPKPLWERVAPADQANRIALATNCIVVDTPDGRILIDSGFGERLSAKERLHHAVADEPGLLANLAAAQVQAASIDFVILSHLHFDHVGGATVALEGGRAGLAFPNAQIVAQKLEWEDATSQLPELAGSYLQRDLEPLAAAGVVRPIDGDAAILPGVRVQRTGCHTPGHQIVWLESRGETAVFLGDLCPTTNHLRTFWTMGYDQFPRATRRRKPQVLGECVERSALVLFDHDPTTPVVRLARDAQREFVLTLPEFAQNR